MGNKSNVIGLGIKLAIIIPMLILGFAVMFSGVHVDNTVEMIQANPELDVNTFREAPLMSSTMLFSIGIIALCAAIVVVFFVVLLATQPAKAVKSILGVIVAALLFLGLYFLTNSTQADIDSLRLAEGVSATGKDYNFTSAGIITAFIAVFAGIAAILSGPIFKLIKK